MAAYCGKGFILWVSVVMVQKILLFSLFVSLASSQKAFLNVQGPTKGNVSKVLNDTEPAPKPTKFSLLTGKKCYGDLGCLELTSEWYSLTRPINLFPLSREFNDVSFILYTRKNKLEGQVLKAGHEGAVAKSYLLINQPTVFILHGFLDQRMITSWFKQIRLELLKFGDMNVLEVNWEKGALPPYTQATANTRLVGLEIAYFVNKLQEKYGLNPENVHLVGHSLGAHISGYAGKKIKRLGRITGLDPAGPYFMKMPSFTRLDQTDALFVDVIHTNAELTGYGLRENLGHIDYYPNDGKSQPGCGLIENLSPLKIIQENSEEAALALVACNHLRAIKFFIESINSPCSFIGYRCSSHEEFLKGECFSTSGNGTDAAVMGFRAKKGNASPNSKFFLVTAGRSPFCLNHYRVTLDLAKPKEAAITVGGEIRITVYSDKSYQDLNLTPNGPEVVQHGKPYKFLLTDKVNIGLINKADIHWRHNVNVLSPKDVITLFKGSATSSHLYVQSLQFESTGNPFDRSEGQRTKLCPVGAPYADLYNSETTTFQKCST